MIRRATLDDISVVLPMAIKFNDEYFGIPLNLVKTAEVICYIIEEETAYVSPGGFIGGIVTEDLMRDWTVLQEVAWYSTDRSGLKLLDAFVLAGQWLDVDEVRVCHLETSSPIVGKLLQRRGFALLETSYRLELGAGLCPHSQPSSP